MNDSPYARVAVLVPCLNEAASIRQVVTGFRDALPGATIYVYDNGSEDDTARVAREAGADVRIEPQRGKGNVIARMFRDVEADWYLLVDGDATYDAGVAPEMMVRAEAEHLDVVIAARKGTDDSQYRSGHQLGNRLFTRIVGMLFGARVDDMLTGYRLMSRRFVKSFPVSSRGFEIETELTIHTLEIGVPFAEIPAPYFKRAADSQSKLSTWRDGFRILRTIATLVSAERPVHVFGGFGMLAMLLALVGFIPVVAEFAETGLVPRFPTLIASTALGIVGLISFFSGLILDGVTRTRRDMKKIAFLAQAKRTAE